MCYDLAHQIRCAKHTFSGRCDITPMVCCSFGGHSTPQFLQCSMAVETCWLFKILYRLEIRVKYCLFLSIGLLYIED